MLFWTYRVRTLGEVQRQVAQRHHPSGGYVIAVWHEHLVGMISSQIGKKLAPMVSRSGSGRLLYPTLTALGYRPVAGSQNRGGKDKGGPQARRESLDLIAKGFGASLTVDGSIGPRRVVKPGAIRLAVQSGASILPAAAMGRRNWQLKTWDELKIPKPFTELIVAFAEPVVISPEQTSSTNFDDLRRRVAEGINTAETMIQDHMKAFSPARADS